LEDPRKFNASSLDSGLRRNDEWERSLHVLPVPAHVLRRTIFRRYANAR
jgi:hypothetical protein